MKDAIAKYIDFLRDEIGLRVSLHGDFLGPALDRLAPYNAHECTYCMHVKSSAECHKRCIESQKRAEDAARGGAFFGSCYAGVGELVFPIRSGDLTVGIISVGGYVGSKEKRSAFAASYGFSEGKLAELCESELREVPTEAERERINTLILPLSAMLTLLCESQRGIPSEAADPYGRILSIIHTGYMRRLRIKDIAEVCHYSPSFITRLFKKKSGTTISAYITRLRMKRAAELLCEGDMRIEDIASAVGYSDTNYFTFSFSSYYGMPPHRFRKSAVESAKKQR